MVADLGRFDTIADVLRHHGRTQPGRTAVHFGDQRLTYGELDARANGVANALIAAGVGPHARIALLVSNCPAYFEIWLGALKANVVLVPINARLQPTEMVALVNDARAVLLFAGAEFYPLIDAIAATLTTVRRVIAVDGNHPRWPDYSRWADEHAGEDPGLPLKTSDCAVQFYTDDSRRHPKGVQISHANLLAMLNTAFAHYGQWREDDVSIVCMPLLHIGGTGWALIALARGAECVLPREFDAAEVLRLIATHGVTKAFFISYMILQMLQAPACATTDLSSLDFVVYGGPLTLELLARALAVFGCPFAQVYGMTETCGAFTCLPPQDHHAEAGERLKSCGRAMRDIEIRIVDGRGCLLAPGQVGEIICRGPRIMLGYWNLPDLTANVIRDGWYHTGESGYLDADGYLYRFDSSWKSVREYWAL
jgi:long-chain acyl-CoA synthetase